MRNWWMCSIRWTAFRVRSASQPIRQYSHSFRLLCQCKLKQFIHRTQKPSSRSRTTDSDACVTISKWCGGRRPYLIFLHSTRIPAWTPFVLFTFSPRFYVEFGVRCALFVGKAQRPNWYSTHAIGTIYTETTNFSQLFQPLGRVQIVWNGWLSPFSSKSTHIRNSMRHGRLEEHSGSAKLIYVNANWAHSPMTCGRVYDSSQASRRREMKIHRNVFFFSRSRIDAHYSNRTRGASEKLAFRLCSISGVAL